MHMKQTIRIHELRKCYQFEFTDGLGPPGLHVVLIVWGVTGTKGPIDPWMLATRGGEGKIHNFTLDPHASVVCHDCRR